MKEKRVARDVGYVGTRNAEGSNVLECAGKKGRLRNAAKKKTGLPNRQSFL